MELVYDASKAGAAGSPAGDPRRGGGAHFELRMYHEIFRSMEDRDAIMRVAAEMGYLTFCRKNAVKACSRPAEGLLFEADPSADPGKAFAPFSVINLPDGSRLERYRLDNNQVFFFHHDPYR